MNKFSKLILAVFIGLLPIVVSAQALILKAPKATYSVGDSFQISLLIDTHGQIINTVSGKIVVPQDKLAIIDTRYGNSIITLWVDRPKISGNEIIFSGGVPGGFGGSAGSILSFGVKAKSEGDALVTLADIKVLLNDGLGTELVVAKESLSLSIKKAVIKTPVPTPTPQSPTTTPATEEPPTPIEVYAPSPDTVHPEAFIPIVSSNPTVADNKYFVSFSAVDKDSGIGHYEITEKPFLISFITSKFDTAPANIESPYVLKWQIWPTEIFIKAYDQAGNFKEGYATKPMHPGLLWSLFAGVLAVAILVTRYIYKPRRPKKRLI